MKIACISLNINTDDLNFGAVLHSWAMQQYLISEYNAEVRLIDYIPIHLLTYNYKMPFLSYFKDKKYRAAFKNVIMFPSYRKRYAKFDAFIEREFNKTDKYNYYSLKVANLDFDVFICESDVIWAATFCNGNFDDNFFLNFPSAKNRKKIAYAPSLSDGKMNQIQTSNFVSLAAPIANISCRETYSSILVSKLLNRKIVHVLDPVFLLPKEKYFKFLKKKPFDQPYIFIYLPVGVNKKLLKSAENYARSKGLKILEYTSSPRFTFDHKPLYGVGVEDFLTAIYYSDCVFTNSFHAICFSVIFNKQFYAFSRKAMGKVEDICNVLNLEERFFKDDNFVEKDDIDYKIINPIVFQKIQNSKEWIEQSLNNK